MARAERFGFVLTFAEKRALQQLSDDEALPLAAVVRRLIRAEAQRRNLWTDVSERAVAEPKEVRC